jgi:hypothetical protein
VASLLQGGERRVDAWLVYSGAAVEVLGLTGARGDSDSLLCHGSVTFTLSVHGLRERLRQHEAGLFGARR